MRLLQLRLGRGEVEKRTGLLPRARQQIKEIAIVLSTGLRQQRHWSKERNLSVARHCGKLFIGSGTHATNDREDFTILNLHPRVCSRRRGIMTRVDGLQLNATVLDSAF